jgi:hypothetical protein
VREGGRAERRLAGQGEIQLDAEVVGERALVVRRELHEQVVRVLPVVERLTAE